MNRIINTVYLYIMSLEWSTGSIIVVVTSQITIILIVVRGREFDS